MTGYCRTVVTALAALILAPLAVTSATAQTRDIADAPPVWTHSQTGVRFATDIGEFHRVKVSEYNPDGSDASVGYELVRGGKSLATVTIYVYPAAPTGSCDDQFAGIKQSILQSTRYKNVAERVGKIAVASPSGKHARTALLASYEFDVNFAGAPQRLRSDAYLFCPTGGKWLVAYRSNWPIGTDASKDIDRLFRSIVWPAMLDN